MKLSKQALKIAEATQDENEVFSSIHDLANWDVIASYEIIGRLVTYLVDRGAWITKLDGQYQVQYGSWSYQTDSLLSSLDYAVQELGDGE